MKCGSNELSWRLLSTLTTQVNARWGWYYYLADRMKVPFKARCRFARPISVLRAKEQVEVIGMAPEEECEREMFVWVKRVGERIAVPLAQLLPLSKDEGTREAVGDWLYWMDRGYEL